MIIKAEQGLQVQWDLETEKERQGGTHLVGVTSDQELLFACANKKVF